MIPVSGNFIEVGFCHKGGSGHYVTVFIFLFILNVAVEDLEKFCTLGHKKRKTLADIIAVAEIFELAAENVVVAAFCVFNSFEISFKLCFFGEGNSVDSGKHFVFFASAPVSAGGGSEFESFDGRDVHKVRSCAKFAEIALFIERKCFAFSSVLINELEFIRLVFHDLFCFFRAHGAFVEFKTGFDDLCHLVFDFFEVINGERFFNVEVIIESVIDSRTDGEFCTGEKMKNSLGHDMGSGVPESFFTIRIVEGEDFNFAVFFDGCTKVTAFAVDFCRTGNSCKSGADALGNLIGGDAVFVFFNVATKGYFNHKFTSCFCGAIKKASPQKLRGEATSSTVPPLFTENLFRTQSSALTRRQRCVRKKLACTRSGDGLSHFSTGGLSESCRPLWEEKLFRFPHQRI